MDKKKLAKVKVVLTMAISVFILSVVLSESFISKAMGAESEKPQYGGILKVISSNMVVNLGYPAAGYTPGDYFLADPAVETLFRLDKQGGAVPWLATGYKVSPDFKTIILTLRKGVKFHDGTDFNAEAVKYLLDIYRTSAMSELKSVESVDVIDSHTVRLNLPNMRFN